MPIYAPAKFDLYIQAKFLADVVAYSDKITVMVCGNEEINLSSKYLNITKYF